MVTLVYIRLTTLIAFLLIVGRTDQPQTLLELIILYIGVCTIFDEDFYQMTSPYLMAFILERLFEYFDEEAKYLFQVVLHYIFNYFSSG